MGHPTAVHRLGSYSYFPDICSPRSGPPALELDWTRSDWATISPLLKALTLPEPPALPTRQSFEAWFDKGLDSLTSILRVNTPHKRPSARSKPWWSPLLTTLRTEYHGAATNP